VDGDGRLDVLVGNDGEANELLLQQGDGSFVALAGFPGGSADTASVALGDVDGDGRLDVLVGNFEANELLLQQGDGSFVALAGFPGGSAFTYSVALGDVDGDGRLDVLVGNDGREVSELLLQQGDGNFVASAGFAGRSTFTTSVALGDVDGDGRLDVLVGNDQGANELLVFSVCPNGGAPLHANSACFACPSFMGRSSESAICRECPPDFRSEGVLGTGERCVIPCTLGERPLGSDTCT